MNNKKSNSKLFVAVAVLAMLACALAIALPASETNATVSETITADPTLPAAQNSVITLTANTTLNGTGTITDAIVLGEYTLTIAKGADITIDYQFTAAKTSVLQFAENAKLIVEEGATLTINASNASTYKAEASAANAIFGGTSGYATAGADTATTGADAAVQVAGTMNIVEDAAVKGVISQSARTFYVTGTFNSNGNGYASAHFLIDNGKVAFDQKDGSVTAYVDISGANATLDVTGTNATGAANETSDDYVLYILGMEVGEGSTVTFDGSVGNYHGNASAGAPDGLTIGTLNNEGTVTVTENGKLDVNKTVTGTIQNYGTIVLNDDAVVTGLVVTGNNVTDERTGTDIVYPDMAEGSMYTDKDGVVFEIFKYTDRNTGAIYQYGLTADPITYDGEPVTNTDLKAWGRGLPTQEGVTIAIEGTDRPILVDGSGVYVEVDVYDDTVEFPYNIIVTIGDARSVFSTSDVIGFEIVPVEIDTVLTIEGWVEGSYKEDVNAPVLTPEVTIGEVTFEYFKKNQSGAYVSVGTDPSKLTAGTYYVVATVAASENYVVIFDPAGEKDNVSNYVEFVVAPLGADSELIFHGLEQLDDQDFADEILAQMIANYNNGKKDQPAKLATITVSDLQSNIVFENTGKTNAGTQLVTVYGKTELVLGNSNLYAALYDYWNTNTTDVIGDGPKPAASAGGYFVAFYVEGKINGVTYDLSDDSKFTNVLYLNLAATIESLGTTVAILELTPKDMPETGANAETLYNDTPYRYYIMYIEDVAANNYDTPDEAYAAAKNNLWTIQYIGAMADFDGITDSEANNLYDQMNYLIDLTYLNYYGIILYDNDKANAPVTDGVHNHTLIYWYAEGAYFQLPSGAYDGFKNWISEKYEGTEEGYISERTFASNSVLVVGYWYDCDSNMRIDLVAQYGTATGGDDNTGETPGTDDPVTPEEPVIATEVMVFINVDVQNNVSVAIIGVDGTVPTTMKVSITYTYLAQGAFGATARTATVDVPVTYEGGANYVVIDVDLESIIPADHFSTVSGLSATVVLSEGAEGVTTNGVQYPRTA